MAKANLGRQAEERVEWTPQPALPARSTTGSCYHNRGHVLLCYARQPLFAVQKHDKRKELGLPRCQLSTDQLCRLHLHLLACTSMLLHDTMMADGRCQIMGNPHDDTTMQVQLLVRCQCGSFQHGLVKQAGHLPCLSGAAFHPSIHPFSAPGLPAQARPSQVKPNQIRQTRTHGREAAVVQVAPNMTATTTRRQMKRSGLQVEC